MLTSNKPYPCSLNNEQWEIIKDLLPLSSYRGRKRSVDLQEIFNAIFYVVRNGCSWRCLPADFPNWHTVYDYYRTWMRKGVIEKISDQLVECVRVQDHRDPHASLCIIDSQSVKAQFGSDRGYDGFKKVRGRKRNILVDALGLPLSVMVDSASKKDHKSAIEMFFQDRLSPKLVNMKLLLADGGYRSDVGWITETRFGIKIILKQSKHTKDSKDSRVLTESNLKPMRWIVERTFAWLNNYRRLSRDYERNPRSSEAMISMAFIHIMLDRLVRKAKPARWK